MTRYIGILIAFNAWFPYAPMRFHWLMGASSSILPSSEFPPTEGRRVLAMFAVPWPRFRAPMRPNGRV
jgi:hypothetical protein